MDQHSNMSFALEEEVDGSFITGPFREFSSNVRQNAAFDVLPSRTKLTESTLGERRPRVRQTPVSRCETQHVKQRTPAQTESLYQQLLILLRRQERYRKYREDNYKKSPEEQRWPDDYEEVFWRGWAVSLLERSDFDSLTL